MNRLVTRRWKVALGLLLAVTIVWVLFYHECASGGAMGGRYRECTCRGVEWVDFDHTAADGPKRTVCLGWVTARTCYRDRGGAVIPCQEIEQ